MLLLLLCNLKDFKADDDGDDDDDGDVTCSSGSHNNYLLSSVVSFLERGDQKK
jgi:hypothetical protein